MDIRNALANNNNDETEGNSQSGDGGGGLTRVCLPEYLVSVKLETSEGVSEVPPGMHNNPDMNHRPPPPFGKSSAMPEFSAWVHTAGQLSAAGADGQHHLPSPYLSHEAASKMAAVPNLKIPNAGIGGLVNGDICDSGTFLNYVLNQQRSNGGIFMFDPRSNVDHPSSPQNYAANCQNCIAKMRNAEGSSADPTTYRDASTNTPVKYCAPRDPDYGPPKLECSKCKTKTENTTKSFYNQLGLQPQKSGKYETPCKACGRPNSNPNTTVCGNCHEAPTALKACKCVQDCNSDCVKNNRRLHFLDVDRPYTCEICLKNYPSESSLVNHLRYHKGNRPYQCETCNKAFATNSHLTTHRRTHSGEKPFECPDCFKTFSDRSSFVKHSRTHGPDGATVKKYKCPVCSNMFVDSCGLKKHIRIHTGERPYVCGVCDKAFATSSTFVAHKRIHSGERPYSCPTCSKRFITKSHLLTHGRVHSGEKPFCCQVCNRAFADGSSYRRHERLHTGENRYTCDVCGKGFPYETSLAKHKQSHVPGTSTYVYMTA